MSDIGPFSRPNGLESYIFVLNRTVRSAAIYWYDFDGKLVRYGVLQPGEAISLDTYDTHPWCCRDENTWDELVLNKSDVYYPRGWQGEETRTTVNIDIPVYKLLERSKQVVRQCLESQDVFGLEIPYHLKLDLHRIEKYDFDLYQTLAH